MSGHSHFKTVMHKKGTEDKKRSKIFSKMSREISVAAREGGGNPATNSKLYLAIERARALNLPKDNIERAIKRGTGELGGEKLETVTFEAYGPGGIAIIIEGITDNKNRTLGEIKQILIKYNGKLVSSGGIRWLFERKGYLTVDYKLQNEDLKNKEKLEMEVIEAGAEDIYWHNDLLGVYTKPEELEKVKKNLEEKEIKIDSASLDWVAKDMVEAKEKDKETCQKLFETLDENDAVQDIYSNLKI